MFKLFEKESIIAYLFFSLLILLIGLKVFFIGELNLDNEGSFLFNHIIDSTSWNINVLKGLIFTIVLFCFYFFSLLYKHFSYHSKAGLVFQFVFGVNTLLAFIFPYSLEHVLVGFLFLILSLSLIHTDQRKDTVANFFNLGFVFTVSIFISSSMIFFLLPIIFALVIFGKSRFRDLLALIIGFFSPLVILTSILVLFNLESVFIKLISSYFLVSYNLLSNWEWLLFGIAVLSAFLTFPIVNSFTINTRKFYIYLFFCFLSVLSVYLLFNVAGNKAYFLVMILASFYLLPFLFEIRSYRTKNFLLFFGLIMAFFATFVQFK
jgi:hypothetical protein